MSIEGGNLGSLFVGIGADGTELDKGLKQAVKNIDSAVQKIESNLLKVGKTLSIAGTAITGTLGVFVKTAVEYGDRIFEASQRTGIAVETLSRLKFVAEQTESSFEALTDGFRKLNRSIFEAETGNSKLKRTFEALGVSLRDENGNFRDTEQVFNEVSQAISKIEDESARAGIASLIFGRNSAGLLPIFRLNSQELNTLSERARQLNVTLDTATAKSFDNFSDKTKQLKTSVSGLGIEITKALLPSLVEMTDKATNFVAGLIIWTKENPRLTSTIIQLTAATGAFLAIVGGGSLAIGALIRGMRDLVITMNILFPVMQTFTTFRLAGLLTDVGILTKNVGIMYPTIVLIGTALASWNITRFLSEISGLDKVLSGENGLLTKILKITGKTGEGFKKLEQEAKQIEEAARARGVKVFEEGDRPVPEAPPTAPKTAEGFGISEDEQKRTEEKLNEARSMLDEVTSLTQQQIVSFEEELQQKSDEELIRDIENANAKVLLTKTSEEQRTDLFRKEQARRQALQEAENKTIGQTFTLLETLTTGFISNSKAAAIALKAIKIGEAVIDGAAALQKINAAWAWNPPVLAALSTQSKVLTALNIATILATGFNAGTDSVPSRLSPGEMVVPNTFSDAIRQGRLSLSGPNRGGNSNGVNIERIEFNVFGNVDEEVAEDMVTSLGREIESRSRGVS